MEVANVLKVVRRYALTHAESEQRYAEIQYQSVHAGQCGSVQSVPKWKELEREKPQSPWG